MFFRHRLQDGRVFIKLALVFFILFNLANFFLHRAGTTVPESVSDPLTGFLFGLALGCFGVGAWTLRRHRTS